MNQLTPYDNEIENLETLGKRTGRLFCPRCGIEFGTTKDCTKHFKKTKHSGDYNTYNKKPTFQEIKKLEVCQAKREGYIKAKEEILNREFSMKCLMCGDISLQREILDSAIHIHLCKDCRTKSLNKIVGENK